MGSYTAHGYLYKPSYGETGRDTTSKFNGGLDLVDAYMADQAFVAWDFGANSLADIVTQIGSDPVTIVFPTDTINIDENTTVPSNIVLVIPNGCVLHVADDMTLTVNGAIEAGFYQIFSWDNTGIIDISGSPTNTIYVEWWGGVADPLNGSITSDNYAAIVKMVDSTEAHQEWRLLNGAYRIATSWIFSRDTGISIVGGGITASAIYIDVGGTGTGVSFGDLSDFISTIKLRDFAFIGPLSVSCEVGVAFVLCRPDVERVNMVVGTTDCICKMVAVEVANSMSLMFNRQPNYPHMEGTSGAPLKIIPVDPAGPFQGWTFNANVLDIHVADCGVYNPSGPNVWSSPIEIGSSTSAYAGGYVNYITGSIENGDPTTSPICFYQLRMFRLDNLYIESGGNSGDMDSAIIFDRCTSTTLTNTYVNSLCWLKFTRCEGTTIAESDIYGMWVRQDCRGTVIKNVSTYININIVDDAPDTQMLGHNYSRSATTGAVITSTPILHNYAPNSNFANWGSGVPAGYTKDGSSTVTQESTEVHWGDYSAKMVTPGGGAGVTGDLYMDVSAAVLQQLKGRLCTATFLVKAPAGQTTSSVGWGTANMLAYIPAWADGADYIVGDAVKSAANDIYFCVVAGTSGALEPTWNTDYLDETDDNGITWVRIEADLGVGGTRFGYVSTGVWQKISFSFVVPMNATSASPRLHLYNKADGSAATYYIADPSVVLGSLSPGGYLPSGHPVTNSLTLVTGGGLTTTTVTDANATEYSRITLTATSAAAASAVGGTGVYVSGKNTGSFVVTHPANPGASATMDYQIVN